MSTTNSFSNLAWFLIYLAASWFVLLQRFNLAARRKFYFHTAPFVVGYASFTAFLLRLFRLQSFFWWYLALSSVFFFVNISRHFRSKDGVEAFTRLEETVLASIEEGEIKGQVQKELAPGRTITQHFTASVVVFVISFMLAFYFSNGRHL